MTIGEQLKKTRMLLGLTQMKMCEGVVTESFYSRVERGLSEINATDLLKILNKHHVSFYDFFEAFDGVQPADQIIHQRIISAFNNHDVSDLKKLDKSKKIVSHKIKLEIKLIIAILTGSLNKISADLKVEMKHNILQIGNWNEKSLWELAIAMPLYDFDEIKLLTNSAFTSAQQINVTDEYLMALSNVAINYLNISYHKNSLNECKKTIDFIFNLPINSTIAMSKIVASYYQALIDNDKAKVATIHQLLKQNGYTNYINFPAI